MLISKTDDKQKPSLEFWRWWFIILIRVRILPKPIYEYAVCLRSGANWCSCEQTIEHAAYFISKGIKYE